MIELSWPQVSARRLERAHLAAPAGDKSQAAVVAAMCGAHAQVMSAAELSVGLRLDGVTRAHVREALWGERSLVKTYGPRGTVHVLPTCDLPVWLSALSSIPVAERAPEGVRLTQEQTGQVVRAVRDVLSVVPDMTIDELSDAVVGATGPWAGDLVMPAFGGMWPRWRQAMFVAAHRGAFVFGPVRGRKVTYTAAPEGPVPLDGRAELARSYLYAYGPATPAHFARWAGSAVGWAAEAFAAAGTEEVLFEGRPAWVLAGDTAMPDGPPRGVRMLPYFDAYVVAGMPRELLYPGPAWQRALAGGQAGNFPVLLVDGDVRGVWHQRRSGTRIDLTVELIGDLTAAQLRELDDQVERVADILEGRPRVTFGPVTVGAHA